MGPKFVITWIIGAAELKNKLREERGEPNGYSGSYYNGGVRV
jgi:hypothetical protein